MKSFLTIAIISSLFLLVACKSDKPLSIEEQAEQLGMTVEEYKETSQKAAQMGMSIDEHILDEQQNTEE